jgi:hypothetical protein
MEPILERIFTRRATWGFDFGRVDHPSGPRYGVPQDYPEDGKRWFCGWCGVNDVDEAPATSPPFTIAGGLASTLLPTVKFMEAAGKC